ncbi:hypothetical protein PBAC_03820 [Pedobacter glucosidilyticus]|nr:alginate export family protein [Pedobacter glucosidilyticus]KHJ39396.1 hypothetical protein PBAC_03820 [Pedobacter glucosidilyticus]
MKISIIGKVLLSILLFTSIISFAQDLDASLQLRPRYEFRNGFRGLMLDNQAPASFIAQRTRLNLNFKQEKIAAKASFQNIRTWGDIKTTATNDKNGVMLFEAWGQYNFNSNWSSRLGRQVITYDNERIFGEIDWIQQGQSHDAIVATYKKGSTQLDIGAALNADTEGLYRDLYVTNYKNMQYVWYHTNITNLQLSLLALNTGFQYKNASPTDLKIDYLQTFGTFLKYQKNKFDANLSLYGQTGKSKLVTENTSVSAYNLALNLNYKLVDKIKAGAGYEILSGKDQRDTENKIKSFNPIFGTNHAFNGLMDYFYVGNHKNTVGLQDFLLKFNYTSNPWKLELTPHLFTTAADVINPKNTTQTMDSYLGTEIDLISSYQLHKNIGITAGYAQMFGSETLEALRGGNRELGNNWAFLMINFNPTIFSIKNK